LSWSPCAIRFNEELQLVDLGDAFVAICTSAGAAKVMQHKYFGGTGKPLGPGICGSLVNELLHPLVWSQGTNRERNAIAVHHLQRVMVVISKTMPNAKELAVILDVKKLTPSTASRAIVATAELPTVDSDAEASPDSTFKCTEEHVFRHADSRTTLQLYENRARSDAAKAEAEQIHYRSQAQLDQMKVMKEGAMAQQEV